ncbi:MAG: DUF3488 domain-containing protein [Pyrinomonadaceae bacterium]
MLPFYFRCRSFYFDWKYQLSVADPRGDWLAIAALSHLILFLSVLWLIQVKVDRDWLFLYLISFFEVLLAAALSIDPSFLAALCVYAFFALSTIICFEARKAQRAVLQEASAATLVVPEQTWITSLIGARSTKQRSEMRHLPLSALVLLALIIVVSIPTFLLAPRFTGSALTRSGEGLGGFIGFSDKVTLGTFGLLQMNDSVVMRVRVEAPSASAVGQQQQLRWRGVALDRFSGKEWSKSSAPSEIVSA